MSANYVKHTRPYPPMTSQGGDEYGGTCQAVCGAHEFIWSCTRERDHPGRHEAGDTKGRAIASWEGE